MSRKSLASWRKTRPTKLAAGMNYTKEAQPENRGLMDRHRIEVNALCVRGTLDKTGAGMWMYVRSSQCGCCGGPSGPKRLTDRGRSRLARLRKKKASQAG